MIRHANLFYYVPFLLYSVPLMRRYLLTSQCYTYHFLCLSHPISLPLTHFRLIVIGLSSTVKWKNIKRLYRIIRRSVYSYIFTFIHSTCFPIPSVILQLSSSFSVSNFISLSVLCHSYPLWAFSFSHPLFPPSLFYPPTLFSPPLLPFPCTVL